jgi:hypothetical protein
MILQSLWTDRTALFRSLVVFPLRRGATLDHAQFAMRARLINVISGLLLLRVGIYDFRVHWSLLQVCLT